MALKQLVPASDRNLGGCFISMRKAQKGFTLIQLSMLLVILGLMGVAAIDFRRTLIRQTYVDKQDDHQDAIQQALSDFFAVNGFFPCPAVPGFPSTDPSFGRSMDIDPGGPHQYGSCAANPAEIPANTQRHPAPAVRMGLVPTRTLGLPDEYAADPHGNLYGYVVTEALTNPGGVVRDPATQEITNGGVDIWDSARNVSLFTVAVPAPSAPCTGAAIPATNRLASYTIIGMPKNGACAWNMNGKLIVERCGPPPIMPLRDWENLDGDNVFYGGSYVCFKNKRGLYEYSYRARSGSYSE